MDKLTIFDADSIIWTIAYKFRNKKVKNLMLISLNNFITEVIQGSSASHYIGFFGSKQEGRLPNFRYAIDPNYKGQRPPEPDWMTKWRSVITDEMAEKWSFEPVEGMEADDAVAICAEYYKDDYDITVASVDKDLKQIPNITYYNYTSHEQTFIDELSAAKAFGEQVLKGDSSDNIKGLFNIGAKKASNLIKPCKSPIDVKWTVLRMYISYEEELRNKAIKVIKAETADEILNSDWSKGKSDKQVERRIRLEMADKVDDHMEEKMPGGWKAYYKEQYSLLKMLTEAPDYFTIPIPIESDIDVVEKDAVKDDFLYL